MKPLLIGIGQDYRGDDAAGLLVARRVLGLVGDAVRVVEHAGDGMDLLTTWEDEETVFVADAVVSGGEVGSVHRFDATEGPLNASMFATSTHALGLSQAVELSRTLGSLPTRLVIYGIEGHRFDTGSEPGAEVLRGVEHVTVMISEEVRCTKDP